MSLARPQAAAHFVSPSPPPCGGRHLQPGEAADCCSPPGCGALRVAFASPLPGATPAARRSRFRGVL
ncbi:MAG: hypothetical protein EOO24_02270, partial [Comamonadaceae bacterium]